MKQESFILERNEQWRAIESILDAAEAGEALPEAFPRMYRALCQDAALAQERGFGAGILGQLEGLAERGHQRLYGTAPPRERGLRDAIVAFPIALRKEWRLFLVMAFLLYGLGAASFLAVRQDPDFAFTLIGAQAAREFEQMYDPEAPHMGLPRETTGDFAAFGGYINNNVSIGFRTFAGGVLFGLGSLFLVGYNGLIIGGVMGHVANLGFGETLWPFVVGHGAFELNAIVVCGICGLRIGLSVIAPGQRKRGAALRHATKRVLPMLYGGTAWLVLAAVIEAFWSSQHDIWPTELFYGVGALLWVGVALYIVFAGRRRAT